MRGEIMAGDLERLKTVYRVATPGRKMTPSYLCLNSSGGNLSEALLISKWLLAGEGVGIATMVDDRASCLSACGLIFLAGSRIDHDVTGFAPMPERWLHVGGRLGFHAPYFDTSTLPDTLTREAAANFYKVAIEASNRIIAIFEHSQRGDSVVAATAPWARSSLFTALMLRGPNEFIYIDTIDAAGRWGIGLLGLKRPPFSTLGEGHAVTACRNVIAWSQDRFAETFGEQIYVGRRVVGKKTATTSNSSHQYTVRVSERHGEDCRVEFTLGSGVIRSTMVSLARDKQLLSLAASGDWWSFIPPETKLAKLMDGALPTAARAEDVRSAPTRKDGQPQTIRPKTKIVSGELRWATDTASSVQACSKRCEGIPFCVGISYNHSNRTCYRHDNRDTVREDPDYTSVWITDPGRN
jgi:hypothetical protein